VIGGGDWSRDRLIPDIVRSFGKGESVEIRSPHAIRPWQHVLEPLSGYIRLAECLASKEGATFAKPGISALSRRIAGRCLMSSIAWRPCGQTVPDGISPISLTLMRQASLK